MNWEINDSDVGYFWDEQWNVPSNGKGDETAEKSSTAHKKEDDPKGSR
jgi:hypothetical protein